MLSLFLYRHYRNRLPFLFYLTPNTLNHTYTLHLNTYTLHLDTYTLIFNIYRLILFFL